jgi:magnesium transporter
LQYKTGPLIPTVDAEPLGEFMKLNTSSTNIVRRLLTGRPSRPLRSLLKRVETADLASLFFQLHAGERKALLDGLVSIKRAGAVLVQIPESQLSEVLSTFDDKLIEDILKGTAIHDGAFLLACLNDDDRKNSLLANLDLNQRQLLQQYLNYPEDSAGRMMTTHFFSVPTNITAQEGLDLLRGRSPEESLYYIYCVNDEQKLVGVVSLRMLVTSAPTTPVEKLARKDVVYVTADTPDEKVAQMVSHYDFIAIPVVNASEQMVGIVTVDDVVDIIQEQAQAEVYARAGLQENDRVHSPVMYKVKHRIPWMVLNLGLSGVASLVVYQFEGILAEIVILAVTKNIVASTSGNTAIQCLTVVTRGISSNDFQFTTYLKAFMKEFIAGSIIGLIMGVISGFLLFALMANEKNSIIIGTVMFLSMMLTSIVGACAGAGVPFLLHYLRRDPAVGSGVLVTMITDIFGFFSFLGLATVAMKFFS